MELYSSKLKREGDSPLPVYLKEDKKINSDNGELFLTAFTRSVAVSSYPNSKWLAEMFHENPLWINQKTAERLGITEGDRVEVESNGTKVSVQVHLTQSIHPEVVAIGRGLGHWAWGHVVSGKKFKSADTDTSLLWWGNGKSFHVSWLIREEKDRVSGGWSRIPTIVKVKKAV